MSEPPDWAESWIPEAKITGYLLSDATPKARARRRFFMDRGFSPEEPQLLMAALMDHLRLADTRILSRSDQHGRTFVVQARIAAPDGSEPIIRSYWIVRADSARPQLTTVIPGGS